MNNQETKYQGEKIIPNRLFIPISNRLLVKRSPGLDTATKIESGYETGGIKTSQEAEKMEEPELITETIESEIPTSEKNGLLTFPRGWEDIEVGDAKYQVIRDFLIDCLADEINYPLLPPTDLVKLLQLKK
jgi:hypothetical protein